MRLATYNIASGGFSSYDSKGNKPERLGLLRKAVGGIDADILGLTDTFRWTEIFTPEQVRSLFNYPYSFHIDMNDTRVDKRIGVALLSRHPIVASKPVRLHNRNAIKATIEVDKKERVEVLVVYLDDLSEATRQRQAEALVERLPNDRPVAVMGDFNAVWPAHAPEMRRKVDAFLDAHPDIKGQQTYKSLQRVLDNLYLAATLPILAAQGLAEPSGMRPTALTQLHPLKLPNIFPVDHILVKYCTAIDYSVLSTGVFELASDHYPLVGVVHLDT